MYLKILEITPTSCLTFRKVPMSHKTISSYHFIPPTVLSGYLYRLIKLANGEPLPTPKSFKTGDVELDEYFILESKGYDVQSLGAYPKQSSKFTSVRMGYQDLSLGITFASDLIPFRISRQELLTLLEQNKHKFKDYDKILKKIERSHEDYRYFKTIENIVRFYNENIGERSISDHSTESGRGTKQSMSNTGYGTKLRRSPLDWEFIIANRYVGYVVSTKEESLDAFNFLENYGFKIGKEGHAFISKIYRTQKLILKEGEFVSDILIPVDANVLEQRNIDLVYYFNGRTFVKDIFALNGSKATGQYFTTKSNDVVIPQATLQKLEVLA